MIPIPQFSPKNSLAGVVAGLFQNNEPGVWYDPSDMTTLFQDAAGTTPVTAVEQPVGLMLDKSKGLVLGPELVTNGNFSNGTTGWTEANPTYLKINGVVNGMLEAEILTSFSGYVAISQTIQTIAGKTYFVEGFVSTPGANSAHLIAGGVVGNYVSGSWKSQLLFTASGSTANISLAVRGDSEAVGQKYYFDNISVRELPGNHAYQSVSSTSRPVLSARVNQYLATETLSTQNVTTLAAQYRLSFEGTGTITLSGTATGVYSAGSHLITCAAGTLTSTVSGSVTKADLHVANTGAGLPAYQRVNTATDYDTVGFPHYLRFIDDDWLVTNTITPGIDKAQVFAGVRKLSDAAQGVVAELSATIASNNGTFLLAAPDGATQTYGWDSKGTTQVDAVATSIAAPITNVLTGIGDISGDSTILRVNGTQAAQNTADQGTGDYGAYPLYIGRRGGTTLPFNGHLYSLIVRFGANLEESKITEVEKYLNYKTLAFDYRDVTDSSSFRWNSATASPDAE